MIPFGVRWGGEHIMSGCFFFFFFLKGSKGEWMAGNALEMGNEKLLSLYVN